MGLDCGYVWVRNRPRKANAILYFHYLNSDPEGLFKIFVFLAPLRIQFEEFVECMELSITTATVFAQKMKLDFTYKIC